VYCGKTAEWIRMPLGMVSEDGRISSYGHSCLMTDMTVSTPYTPE